MKKLIAVMALVLAMVGAARADDLVKGVMIRQSPTVGSAVAPVNSVSGLATELRNTTLASFSASTGPITTGGAGSMVDMCAVYGSATKTVKVTRVAIEGSQTTSGIVTVKLAKFSTINIGAVLSTPTVVPMDSANSAGTGYMVAYTTNPTLGTLVGEFRDRGILFPAPAATATSSLQELYGYTDQPIVLRGIGEHVDAIMVGAPLTGGKFNCNFTWTEE